VLAIVAGVLVGPGVGHAWAGRWWRGLAWALLGLAAASGVVSVYFLWAAIAIRVLQVIDLVFIRVADKAVERRLIAVALFVIGGVGATEALRVYVVEPFNIPSAAMAPTLQAGDQILVDKTGYRSIDRGDVIVFAHPCNPARSLTKRVVALEHDTVEVRCSVLYVNGVAQARAFVRPDALHVNLWRERIGGTSADLFLDSRAAVAASRTDFPRAAEAPACPNTRAPRRAGEVIGAPAGAAPCGPQIQYVVPPEHVFVLGDNRDNSADSRTWGPVPVRAILGRVVGVWWSKDLRRIRDL